VGSEKEKSSFIARKKTRTRCECVGIVRREKKRNRATDFSRKGEERKGEASDHAQQEAHAKGR